MSRAKPTAYTPEFRQNAIKRTLLPGNTVASVALELKIPTWKLRDWIKQSRAKLERGSELDEVVKLQRENKRLKEEVEILKKAAAYFAKSLL
jgi:transposase